MALFSSMTPSARQFTTVANRINLLSIIVIVLMLSLPCQAAMIVLDPGHGGNDGGAGDAENFPEKQFCLELVKSIAGILADRHRVELTRVDDVALSPEDRAARANNLEADLMISLHAAVSPYCRDRSVTIYYLDDRLLSIPPEVSLQIKLTESDTGRPAWINLQMRHQHQSQNIAAAMKRSLLDSGRFDQVTVSGVPLFALMGVDLPAVMVEVGCIHPSAIPNRSMVERQIAEYAQAIADAIASATPRMVQ